MTSHAWTSTEWTINVFYPTFRLSARKVVAVVAVVFFLLNVNFLTWKYSRFSTSTIFQQSSTQVECWWLNVLRVQAGKSTTSHCSIYAIKQPTNKECVSERVRGGDRGRETEWLMEFCSHIFNETFQSFHLELVECSPFRFISREMN